MSSRVHWLLLVVLFSKNVFVANTSLPPGMMKLSLSVDCKEHSICKGSSEVQQLAVIYGYCIALEAFSP